MKGNTCNLTVIVKGIWAVRVVSLDCKDEASTRVS
jgi:hypothetical protein